MKSCSYEKAPCFQPVEGADMYLIGDGKNMTLTRIHIKPGAVFPDHAHPNEQIGTCVKGEGILRSAGVDLDVKPGVTWTIPPNEEHMFETTGDEPVVIYEAWSPPREDYKKLAGIVD
ncbi:MAG TPA: cupin domain-containing protein [Patescibacteria group bacterium]|nr:cupin domain-containing protein [Patescibacteria group bacterium]